MKVPTYDRQIPVIGGNLPNVNQSNPATSAAAFIDPVQQQALTSVVDLSGQIGNDLLRSSLQEQHQRQQEMERTRQEADAYRAQDALNQLQTFTQDQEYGPQGWRNVTGGAVFSQQSGGKPLTDVVMDGFQSKRNELMQGLGTERQQGAHRSADYRRPQDFADIFPRSNIRPGQG